MNDFDPSPEQPNLFANGVWRLLIQQDGDTFMRDELNLHIGYRDQDGWRFVLPMSVVLTDPMPNDSAITSDLPEPTRIPRELAELLLDHLAHALLGRGDIVAEIRRVTRQRDTAERRLDLLLQGLAIRGGQK